ncbi:MAG: EpsG family protein [Bacteroides sp.]|nr:EpsG family protein [Bacteroides sp.]
MVVALLLGILMKPNSGQKKKRRYIVIVFTMVILISALRKYTVGKDLAGHYYNTFLRIRNLPWSTALNATSYEKGYVTFYKVVGAIFDNPQWMIIIYSLFVFGIVGWFIYKNSEDVVLSVFLFISCNTWFMELTMMRQTMAISVGLVAIEIWKHKEWKIRRYVLFGLSVLLAVSFHSTGIVIAIFPLIERLPFKRKHIFLTIVALTMSFVMYDYVYKFAAGIISFTRDYIDFYEGTGYGAAGINTYALYELFIAIFCFTMACWTMVYRSVSSSVTKMENIRKIEKYNLVLNDNYLLYMVLFLVMCRLLRMRIYIITRMAYYFIPFIWILYPRAIKNMRGESNRFIVRAFIYTIFMAVFLVVGYKKAADFYGTVPYVFFWR